MKNDQNTYTSYFNEEADKIEAHINNLINKGIDPKDDDIQGLRDSANIFRNIDGSIR